MLPGGKTSDLEIEKILESVGLSSREARTYLELARAGRITASELAKKTGTARPETYEILRKLENKGFIREFLARPMRFESVDPLELRNRIIQDERKKLSSIETGMSKILEVWPFLTAVQAPSSQAPRTATIHGRKRIAALVEDMISGAQESVRVFTTRRGLMTAMERSFPEIVSKLIEKGVDVRLLIDERSAKRISAGMMPENVDVRISKGPRARFYLVDDRDVVYHLHLQAEEDIWGSDEVAMWTDSPDQVNVYRWLFSNEWDHSMPLRTAPVARRESRRGGT